MIQRGREAVVMGISPRSLLPPTVTAIVVAIVGLAFAQSRTTASGARTTTAVVSGHATTLEISNYAYTPVSLTVRVGIKITVTNADGTAHTVTARSGAFDSGTVNGGKSHAFTVTKPGIYAYYCQFHAFMSGTIKVIK